MTVLNDSLNLTPRTIIEHPAVNEILTKYLNYLLCKKALKPATITRKVKIIKNLLKQGVELPNPDNVIGFLNTCGWASGTKDITIDAYRDYLNMLGLAEVKLPHIRREQTLPFVLLPLRLMRLFLCRVTFRLIV